MAFRQRTAFGLALLAAAAASPSALGQTLELGTDQDAIGRDPAHDKDLGNDEINKADCVRDEIIQFHINVQGVVDDKYDFQIWRGTGCTDRATRLDGTSNCVRINKQEDRNDNAINVDIGVREIMAAYSNLSGSSGTGGTGGGGGTGGDGGTAGSAGSAGSVGGAGSAGSAGTDAGTAGTTAGSGGSGATGGTDGASGTSASGGGTGVGASICVGDPTFPEPTEFSLHFIYVDGNGEPPPTNYAPAIWNARHDVVPPAAPRNVEAGIGESTLVLSWEIEDDQGDIDRFRAYCDPPPSAVIEDGAGGAGDGPTGDCDSTLGMGDEPPAENFCGESDSYSASMQTSTLQNNVKYTVAVTAVDFFNNEGTLSDATCEAPQLVRDYYEAYRQSGGEGGGGFCAIGAGRSKGFALLIAAAGLAFLARRRRTQSRREAS